MIEIFINSLIADESICQIGGIRVAVQKELTLHKDNIKYCENLHQIIEILDGTFSINGNNEKTQSISSRFLRRINDMIRDILDK